MTPLLTGRRKGETVKRAHQNISCHPNQTIIFMSCKVQCTSSSGSYENDYNFLFKCYLFRNIYENNIFDISISK